MSNALARNVTVALAFDSTVVQDVRFIGSEEGPRPIPNLNPGQSSTLLYEIVPAGKSAGPLTVTVNYEDPASNEPRSLVFRYADPGNSFAASSTDFRFAAAVASFGMILSDSGYKGAATIDSVRRIVADSIGTDSNGMRREFLQLVQRTAQLQQ
jgi:Ca-activated chloride channel family protein